MPAEPHPVRPSSAGSSVATSTATIIDRFHGDVSARGGRIALRYRYPDRDGWGEISWSAYGRMVDEVAAGLIALGVGAGDRVGVLSQNRAEWHVADIAAMSIGAVTVPVYPTSATNQVAFVLRHAKVRVCFVEDAAQLAKVSGVSSEIASLEHIVCFEPTTSPKPTGAGAGHRPPLAYEELRIDGARTLRDDPTIVTRRAGLVHDTDVATVVYTSGTTGPPKGTILTHRNITATIDMIQQVVLIGPEDRSLSFLPLSHIAERVVSEFGHIASGGETWFARSFSTLAADIRDCRPTIFFAVPRVWEKMRDSIEVELSHADPVRRALVARFAKVAGSRLDARAEGRDPGLVDRVQFEALNRTVGALIRRRVGLDRSKVLVSGAAPIDPALLRWLAGVGLVVGEVYGQTEVCGPTSLTPPGRVRVGTTGPPLPGVEVRIAEDGEILVRGANVCAGYLDDEPATRALLDPAGWLHSGDTGLLDAAGFLRITGRKTDLMKTANGQYVAPQDIETALRSQRFIAQAVVIGEGRPFVAALIELDVDSLAGWARHRGKTITVEALSSDRDVEREVNTGVERVNATLNHVEQIKKWRILPRALTIDAGELTPTLKVVRKAVQEHFADAIAELYAVTPG